MRIILILIYFFLLTACQGNESTLKHSLVYCPEGNPKLFNPQLVDDVATIDATTNQLYNRLVKRDQMNQKILPDLATHWIQNKNENSITFFLRKNIAFHHTAYFSPTRNFNADDVIFSFNRMLKTTNPFHAICPLSDNYFFNHPFYNSVKTIIKIDDYTVKFLLRSKVQYFLDNLTDNYSIILSKEYAQQLLAKGTPKNIDYFPIGTGPYKFKSFSRNNLIRYQANTKYWQGKPSIDNLIYSVTPQSIQRYAKLLSGKCEVIIYPSPTQIKKISKDKSYRLSMNSTYNIILLAFNTKRTALKNKNVRHILSQVIDKKQINSTIFFNTAEVVNSILTPDSWAFAPNLRRVDDPSKITKKDLALLRHNVSKPLIILAPKKGAEFDPLFKTIAKIIKYNFDKIGVQSKIFILGHIDLHKRLNSGHYDLYLTRLKGNPYHPINMFIPILSCDSKAVEGNSARWCNRKTQKLLNNILTSSRLKQKKQKYHQLQKLIQREYLYLPIVHVLRFDVMQANISGISLNPLTGINFFNVKKQGSH
ncbi:MAG: ABC transporter substrate-binding protein [Psychromonas sp.]|nr:ABC transporter substrate-binding protein [Psychromonas sp.]